MTIYTDIAKSLNHVQLTPQEHQRLAEINTRIPGWSGAAHYAFFKALVMNPRVERILVLGVYHGRDLAYLLTHIGQYRPIALSKGHLDVIGVDKFSDTPCADWPEAKRTQSWQEAGFGAPPSIEQARHNLEGLSSARCLALAPSDDEAYLRGQIEVGAKFDAVYLDTSHDGPTVARQISQVEQILKPEGILCGDDYLERPEWGVIETVRKLRPAHTVFGPIWLAPAHVAIAPITSHS